MNHIRLLIRNQCGSHMIHGIPNYLAFQQNYSRYDGPSESGSFFTLSKPGLTLFLPTAAAAAADDDDDDDEDRSRSIIDLVSLDLHAN